MNKYEVLHAKVNRAQSYKALREAIHSSNPPVIPYLYERKKNFSFKTLIFVLYFHFNIL